MNIADIWGLVMTNGLSILAIAVAVFLLVWVASWVGLLSDGTSKRIGVLVSAYLLSGYSPGEIDEGITLVVGAVLAALVNEFKGFIEDKIE